MVLRVPAGLTLYFCRHGETEANVEGRFQGWTLDTPLTASGRQQSRTMARVLARDIDPKRIRFVSSPLPRAIATMKIIRESLGVPGGGFDIDPRLMEINLGAWDGLTHEEARARDPAAYDARESDKWHVRVPGGGENYADVAARAESFVAGLAQDTFAVAHGAFNRILRGLFAGMTWREMSDLDEPQGVVFRARDNDVMRLPS
jgi:broad specificity phosphatase PhoE